MSYVVLARKWRPKKFEDVIGQEHIVGSLKHALASEQVGHAYLFAGTRGIGKTSMARLFAKALRCDGRAPDGNPCGICPSCKDSEDNASLNIIEIDGASNNKVEDVRDLIENVRFLPTTGRYKVYIIDEVHMLSTSAFNALLKTLEEPPAHVIFLLATTEPKKLLGTVLSRCQRFDFRNASVKSLEAHVEKIATAEGIKFESPGLVRQICVQGQGSIRDTLSLLDQVISLSAGAEINAEIVALALGTANLQMVDKLLVSIFEGQSVGTLQLLEEIYTLNVSAESLSVSLMERLFEVIQNLDTKESHLSSEVIRASSSLGAHELIWIYETLAKDLTFVLELGFADKALSVALLKLAKRRDAFAPATLAPAAVEEKKKTELTSAPPAVLTSENDPEPVVEPVVEPEPEEVQVIKVKTFAGFLDHLRQHGSLTVVSNLEQGNLRAPFFYNGEEVRLDLGYAKSSELFYDHVSENESRRNLIQLLADFFDVKSDHVGLNLELIEEDFASMADEQALEKEEQDKKRRVDLLDNPLIKEAESMFNSKIDKVILSEEK